MIPDFNGDIVTSQPGTVTLEGTSSSDAFTFSDGGDLGINGADTITNFNRRKDLLAFDSEGFPNLGNAKGKIKIKTTNKPNKKFDRLMKSNNDFVFVKKTGMLYYNDNGKKDGAGEDGLVVILKALNQSTPTTSNSSKIQYKTQRIRALESYRCSRSAKSLPDLFTTLHETKELSDNNKKSNQRLINR